MTNENDKITIRVFGILQIILGVLIFATPFMFFTGNATKNELTIGLVFFLVCVGFVFQGIVNILNSKKGVNDK